MNNQTNQIPAPVHHLVGQLRELLARGTPGPWHDSHMEWDESGRVIMAGGRDRIKVNWNGGTWRKQCEADAAMIATAVNALPALLNVIELADAAMCLRNNGDPHGQMGRIFDQLTHALSLLPNPSDQRAALRCSDESAC